MIKVISVLFLSLSLFAYTPVVYAQVPFGGLDVIQIPCTCTAGYFWAVKFVPFFNPSVPTTGVLVYQLGSIKFLNYVLHPGAWALGLYIPGAGQCYIGFAPYCVYVPNFGLISPITGTSL